MATVGPGGADWDDIYVGDGSDTEPFDHHFLADALQVAPGRALDLGCGAGGNAIGLASRGWIVTGLDLSPNAIKSARISARAAEADAGFLQVDMTTWRSDILYDLVYCLFALPPRGRARDALISAAGKALSPGGLLIVGEWERIDAGPHRYVTISELIAALRDLEIIRAELVDADPEWSQEQVGLRSWPAVLVTAGSPL